MRILLIIFLVFGQSFAKEFYKLSEFGHSEAKQDSGTVWVENPIPDQELTFQDTVSLNISWVYNKFPGNIDWSPTIENPLLLSANIFQDDNYNLIMKIISKNQSGHTKITYTAFFYEYAYTDSLHTDSIATDTLTMNDTFAVTVYNPAYEWKEWGTNYSFNPENCFGSGDIEWKAAVDFDLGTEVYELKEIEFGYGLDGTAEWKITRFTDVPGDSVFWDLDSAFCTENFLGDEAGYIEIPADSSLKMTGKISVVFTTTANFMAMDPSGDSDHTWIYSESTGWEHPEAYSPDYSGAWHIRLLVNQVDPGTTGVEEIFTTEKDPVLLSSYPNPFNNQTIIKWKMVKSGYTELNIFNSKGQFVKNLVKDIKIKGNHSFVFNADGLDSGIYYCQLIIDGKTEFTNKILYLK